MDCHNVQMLASDPVILDNTQRHSVKRAGREDDCWRRDSSPWAQSGSKRYLWNDQSVARAIDYVVNGQGGDLPDFA